MRASSPSSSLPEAELSAPLHKVRSPKTLRAEETTNPFRARAATGRPLAARGVPQRPLRVCAVERREAHLLLPVRVEIIAREEALEGLFARRPLAVDDREPGRVAIAALDDEMLAEEPLE